jgi:hypothetical protein
LLSISAIIVAALVVAAGDGGSGTYVAAGHDYDVAFYNSGTTAWRAFALTAPPGLTFIGGTTGNEGSVACAASGNEIHCGPIGFNVMPPQAHLTFVATMKEAAVCGPTFALSVSGDGSTYTPAGDIGPAAGCAPHALTRPVLHRIGTRIHATPPAWSSPPTRVVYRWQRCTGSRCVAIAHGLVLALKRSGTYRLVATATIAGQTVATTSRALRYR